MNCVRKHIPCGEKTRRGGAQETVRITVLEQLVKDFPSWTLQDAINHCKGRNDEDRREQSVDSSFSETTEYSDQTLAPSDASPLGSVAFPKVEVTEMDYSYSLRPHSLRIDQTFPGEIAISLID